MSVWDSITGAISSVTDSATSKWNELSAAVSNLQDRASKLKAAYAEMQAMRPSLSPEKQAEADQIGGLYSTVAGYVDSAMAAFRKAFGAISESSAVGLGAVPVLALGLIVAAIPVVYFATDAVNTAISRVTAFTAGERAARAVLENGGSAQDANNARVQAMQAAAAVAKASSSSFGSGMASLLKAALPVAAIVGAIYFLPRFLPSKRESPSVAFNRRKALRGRK